MKISRHSIATYVINYKTGLIMHMKSVHSSVKLVIMNLQKKWSVERSQKWNDTSLQKHTSIYDQKCKCNVCSKEFLTNDRLKDHRNVHTCDKPLLTYILCPSFPLFVQYGCVKLKAVF
jgi:uncharacterized Zn-finger protein